MPPATLPEPKPPEIVQQPILLSSAKPPELPPMRDALAAASAELRRCSKLGGSLLVVDWTVADGDGFATIAVGPGTEPAAEHCAREVATALRFQPEGPLKVTEEYTP